MWPFTNRNLGTLLANPAPKYLATVRVVLHKPGDLERAPRQGRVRGYFQVLGVLGPRSRARELLTTHVEDGEIDWEESELEEVDPRRLERAIRKAVQPPDERGVWYVSGRALFGDE